MFGNGDECVLTSTCVSMPAQKVPHLHKQQSTVVLHTRFFLSAGCKTVHPPSRRPPSTPLCGDALGDEIARLHADGSLELCCDALDGGVLKEATFVKHRKVCFSTLRVAKAKWALCTHSHLQIGYGRAAGASMYTRWNFKSDRFYDGRERWSSRASPNSG